MSAVIEKKALRLLPLYLLVGWHGLNARSARELYRPQTDIVKGQMA